MNKLVVVTSMEQLSGFQLAGVDAIGVEDPEALASLITSWLDSREHLLLALDDELYGQLPPAIIRRLHSSDEVVLVTIPDGVISRDAADGDRRMYDMIRHATGQQIRFKGKKNGTANRTQWQD